MLAILCWQNFAIGAMRPHLVSRDEGVGSARFVRLADQPDTAEPAVTIVDAYQGKGLGARMLQGNYYGTTLIIWAALIVAAALAATLVSSVGLAERITKKRMGFVQ